jgi:YggT family protein
MLAPVLLAAVSAAPRLFVAPAQLPGLPATYSVPAAEQSDELVPVYFTPQGGFLQPRAPRAPSPKMILGCVGGAAASAAKSKIAWQSVIALYAGGFAGFLKFYVLLISMRIYTSWFVNINMYRQPLATLATLTDPFMRVFRGLLPPILGLDMSVIMGFILLHSATTFFEGLAKTA